MERLILKNFGPIPELDIELKKINLFIGEQGVGKSTIAKVLTCVRDLTLLLNILSRAPHIEDKSVMQILQIHGIHEYFNTDSYIEYTDNDGIILQYINGKFSLSHSSWDNEKIGHIILNRMNDGIRHSAAVLDLQIQDPTDFFEENNQFDDASRRIILSNMRQSFYCPAERGITGNLSSVIANILLARIPLPHTLLEYLSFFEKAKKEYPTYDVPFMDISFSSKNNRDTVSVDGKDLSFEYCSSGIQSVVPLLMVIDYCIRKECFTSFTIEEPELNLFPTNQLALMRFLLSKINGNGNPLSMCITTHSPYILSILNISILASKIADMNQELSDEACAIIPKEYHLKPTDIAAFSLGKDTSGEKYCKPIIDGSTGLIKANYLDSVSDIVSSEFNRLYSIYTKAIKRERHNS